MPAPSRAAPKKTGWTSRQWAAIRSPSRVHLLAALQALGEASVAEIAELTGRSRQSIYPHLASMARAGIVGTGLRMRLGREITVFRFLPEQLAASVDQASGRGLGAGADVSAGALKDAQLRCRRWGKVADGVRIDLARNPEAITSIRVSWLDDRLRARLNRLLRKASAVLQEGCARRKGRRTLVLMYHFPDYTAGEARKALAAKASGARRRRGAAAAARSRRTDHRP